MKKFFRQLWEARLFIVAFVLFIVGLTLFVIGITGFVILMHIHENFRL